MFREAEKSKHKWGFIININLKSRNLSLKVACQQVIIIKYILF